MENSFKISGFVGYVTTSAFSSSSVCRFSIAVSRKDKNSEKTTAFINVETWAKNEEADKLKMIEKGCLLTIEGYFKPEEWTDNDGNKHNNVVWVVTKFYPTNLKDNQ